MSKSDRAVRVMLNIEFLCHSISGSGAEVLWRFFQCYAVDVTNINRNLSAGPHVSQSETAQFASGKHATAVDLKLSGSVSGSILF